MDRIFTTKQAAEMSDQKDRLRFLRDHATEIQPLLSDSERDFFDLLLRNGPGTKDNKAIDSLIEKFETKIFLHEKDNPAIGSQRILITANDGGAYTAASPMIRGLMNDDRCKAIGLLISGIAEKRAQTSHDNARFHNIRSSGSENVIEEVLELTQEKPFDIGIGTVTSINGPESLLLYAGKSSLKLKKLYLILEGWTSLGSSFENNTDNLDQLDGIFCNDQLAKKLVQKTLPNFPKEKIFTTGTGRLDSLELEKAEIYELQTRKRLGLDPETVVILYLGGISSIVSEIYDIDERIEEKTFEQTLDALSETARKNPDKNFALMLRTHPADPNKAEYLQIAKAKILPNNVKFIDANSSLTINEASYAADLIASTCSTENFSAHFRNRKGVFVAFDEPGLGYDLLKQTFGDNLLHSILETDGLILIKSPKELSNYLAGFKRNKINQKLNQPMDSTKKILDIIFSD